MTKKRIIQMAQKRSISDDEIALIKAMIERNMQGKDIQFFFNRPDRAFNSGRISNIKDGTYGRSKTILAASNAELETFLKGFKRSRISATISIPAAVPVSQADAGPMDEHILLSLFTEDAAGVWHYKHGESDRHECKENFGFKYAGKWLRAVAALANNSGGYIVFGVKDKSVSGGKLDSDSYKVIGLTGAEFDHADPVDFTKLLKSTFDPTPNIEVSTVKVGTVNVGVMYVHQHTSRPIISQRGDGKEIKEGDIFFRYPGQSSRIKYSDLRGIFDDRDRQAREQILPMVERLLKLGPQNAMVADLSNGVLASSHRSIVIGEELLDKIKFIREGDFSETEGEATLKLVGDVTAVDKAGAEIRKGFVTQSDLLEDFLSAKSPYDPKEYIRCAIEGGNAVWLPIHFYASKAGLDCKGLSEFIKSTQGLDGRKKSFVQRALENNSAFKTATGDASIWLDKIKKGTKLTFGTEAEAVLIVRAITGLEQKPSLPLKELLSVLKECWELMKNTSGGRSNARKAICRVDEIYYLTVSPE